MDSEQWSARTISPTELFMPGPPADDPTCPECSGIADVTAANSFASVGGETAIKRGHGHPDRPDTLRSTTKGTMSLTSIPPEAIGYVYRTDCPSADWSYIGQSLRLDADNVATYFGSGELIRTHIVANGPEGLTKTILATADNPVGLHYEEMIAIAAARRDGVPLLNGDFGGPRPFPVMQAALRDLLPEAAASSRNPERFLQLLTEHRDLVEQAIIDAAGAPADLFYAGLERDLLAIEDLSYECPTCHAVPGAVCCTNSTSLTKPRNPSRNHAKRPRLQR